MRLIFVSHSLPPENRPLANIGGMQRVALELLGAMRARTDVSVEQIVMRSTWSLTNVRIVPFLLATALRLRRRIQRGEADAILFTSMVTGTLILALGRRLRASGVRTGVIVHGLDVTTPNRAYQAVVRRVLGAADRVLPVSRATGEACLERGLAPERLRVVHNGIDTSRFPKAADRTAARRRLEAFIEPDVQSAGGRRFFICSVGRHVRRKGFAWFIRNVLPALPERVHYLLVGEGPEHRAIAEAIEDTGMENRVHLLGRLGDEGLQAVYRGSDLFLMPNIPVPNDMEGFGIVMLEAGLNGLPSVASRLEGIREVIKDGENGVFVEPQNAEGFVAAIGRFESDESLLSEARFRAERYTRENFGWERAAEKYVDALGEQPLPAP